jgi:hypothetical protein
MAMHYADVIVIDVSEPSDNVIWELQTAAAWPPESILLTCAVKDTTPAGVEAGSQSAASAGCEQYPLGSVPDLLLSGEGRLFRPIQDFVA